MINAANKPVVWITGAGGLIGSYLVRLAPELASQFETRGSNSPLDLLDSTAVRKAFCGQKPAAIIHCAAMSKSPDCQANPAQARSKVNVEATALLAELAAEIPFLLFSTDLVFNGRKGNYVETDAVEPLSIYAETKVAAEQIVLANPRHTVIRTSLNGGTSPTGDRGFNEQMRRVWQMGQTQSFFTDEYRSPISAAITARATWELLQQKRTGLFHVAGAERMSRAAIGEVLAARWPQLNPRFTVSSLKDYRGAPRSPDTSLNSAKAQAQLSFPLPGLTAWLRENPTEVF